MLLGKLNRILVPVDLSPASLAALREGVELAAASGATVVLLTVIDTRFPFPELYSFDSPGDDYFRAMRESALKRMGEALAGLPSVPTEKLVVRGRAKVEIPAVARDADIDLIVMPSHGEPGTRAIVGSVTEAVVRHTPCPVLVLPVTEHHVSPLPGA